MECSRSVQTLCAHIKIFFFLNLNRNAQISVCRCITYHILTFQILDLEYLVCSDLCHQSFSSPDKSLCRDHTSKGKHMHMLQKCQMWCFVNHQDLVLFYIMNWLYTHHAIVIFGLQVQAAYDVDSDQALLRTALRQLPKLPRWVWDIWVIWQGIHSKRPLWI